MEPKEASRREGGREGAQDPDFLSPIHPIFTFLYFPTPFPIFIICFFLTFLDVYVFLLPSHTLKQRP
jgi:hypothetical protein